MLLFGKFSEGTKWMNPYKDLTDVWQRVLSTPVSKNYYVSILLVRSSPRLLLPKKKLDLTSISNIYSFTWWYRYCLHFAKSTKEARKRQISEQKKKKHISIKLGETGTS